MEHPHHRRKFIQFLAALAVIGTLQDDMKKRNEFNQDDMKKRLNLTNYALNRSVAK